MTFILRKKEKIEIKIEVLVEVAMHHMQHD